MDYKAFTNKVLKEKLEARNLKTDGVKAKLIERLEENDAKIARARRNDDRRVYAHRGRDNAEENSIHERRSDNSRESAHHSSDANLEARRPFVRRSTISTLNNDNTPTPSRSSSTPINRLQAPYVNPEGGLSDLSEATLEQICRDNYLHFEQDFNGIQRRAEITAKAELKYLDLLKKKNADFSKADKIKEKAQREFETETAKARVEKADRMKVINDEVAERHRKQQIFRPALVQLQALQAARGDPAVRASEFAPGNLSRYQRRSVQTPAIRSSVEIVQNQEQVRDTESARECFERVLERNLTDRGMPRDRDNFRRSTPSSTTALSSADPTPKRKTSDSTFATSSSGEKRQRTVSDSRTSIINDVPRGPRADSLIETVPIRQQLTNNPYIFIASSNLPVRSAYVEEMDRWLKTGGFAQKHVRADERGYFVVVFEGSRQGESQTRSCYGICQGREFRGVELVMELCVRGGR